MLHHTTTQTPTPQNHYAAERVLRGSEVLGWRGWMVYAGSKNITETPSLYTTKREALEAIKAQHP